MDTTTDSKGRKLSIEEPGILAESQLVRRLGAEASGNTPYMLGYVMPAVSVVKIDDEEIPFPQSQKEVDALIQRLGREGLSAVMRKKFPELDEHGQPITEDDQGSAKS